MKIKQVYVGSWYPRTLFHLNEMYQFLLTGESYVNLDKEKLKKLKSELNPTEVELKQNKGQSYLKAKFDIYQFESFESGLSLFSCDCLSDDLEEMKGETKKMSEFAFKKVFSSFNYLYSLGAPIPKVFSALKSVMPFVFVTEGISKEEVENFLKTRGETITKEFSSEKAEVYYGSNTIIIDGDLKFAKRIVKECVYYLHDAEAQLHKILNLHRYIWDEVSSIKSSKTIKYKDLPKTRDLLTEIESDVIFFESRINQLKNVLETQKKRVSQFAQEEDDYIWDVFEDGFQSLQGSEKYVKNLWQMTRDYVSGATNLINTIYQESSDKQVNTLQFVFIIAAVASLVALGEVVSADIVGKINMETGLITATEHSFSWMSLLKLSFFSVITGGVIYYLWEKLYHHFAGSKISDPKMIKQSKLNKAKKMFN
ncbi:MAG: hypothetical protein PF488_03870 [Patescibacteria group bacterium]|jgi:hypothetical protein|nr:hypothetical protein [Patescibacteria group bacterium]